MKRIFQALLAHWFVLWLAPPLAPTRSAATCWRSMERSPRQCAYSQQRRRGARLPGLGVEARAAEATSRRTGRVLHVFQREDGVERVGLHRACRKCKTAVACRSQYWSDPGPLVQNPKAVVQFEDNGFAVVKFLMPSVEGVTVNQLNYSAHTVRDGYWVDMHLSKADSTRQDEALFKSFLSGVSFQPKAQ